MGLRISRLRLSRLRLSRSIIRSIRFGWRRRCWAYTTKKSKNNLIREERDLDVEPVVFVFDFVNLDNMAASMNQNQIWSNMKNPHLPRSKLGTPISLTFGTVSPFKREARAASCIRILNLTMDTAWEWQTSSKRNKTANCRTSKLPMRPARKSHESSLYRNTFRPPQGWQETPSMKPASHPRTSCCILRHRKHKLPSNLQLPCVVGFVVATTGDTDLGRLPCTWRLAGKTVPDSVTEFTRRLNELVVIKQAFHARCWTLHRGLTSWAWQRCAWWPLQSLRKNQNPTIQRMRSQHMGVKIQQKHAKSQSIRLLGRALLRSWERSWLSGVLTLTTLDSRTLLGLGFCCLLRLGRLGRSFCFWSPYLGRLGCFRGCCLRWSRGLGFPFWHWVFWLRLRIRQLCDRRQNPRRGRHDGSGTGNACSTGLTLNPARRNTMTNMLRRELDNPSAALRS